MAEINNSDGELLTITFHHHVNNDDMTTSIVRKIEGSQQLWKRFVILPNIHGQKVVTKIKSISQSIEKQ
jgi:hypothetical protein